MSCSEFDLETALPTGSLGTTVPLASNPLGSTMPLVSPGSRHETPRPSKPSALHRVQEVRHEQGVSIRRAAQLMRKSVDELRHEEDESTDLSLTQIYEWQKLLEVPVADLLVEPHAPLSAPVLRRAQMVRLMKTVQAIMERSTQSSVRRLAQTMVNQLVEIMPELEGVTPWNSLDHRSQNQNCRLLEQAYADLTGERPGEPR